MEDVVFSTEPEVLDPKVLKVIKRVSNEFELALEKVAANHAQPAKYPLPADPQSTERTLAAIFNTLSAEKKQHAAALATSRINVPLAVRTARFAELAKVDLTKSDSVKKQSIALPMPVANKIPQNFWSSLPALHLTPAVLPTAVVQHHLELRLRKVYCEDETGSTSIGSDEIAMGGFVVDALGVVHSMPTFDVRGGFDTGEDKKYDPPKVLYNFSLDSRAPFPQRMLATLVLVEKDGNGFSAFMDKLVDAVRTEVTDALAGSIPLPLPAQIRQIIAAAISKVFGFVLGLFKSIWANEDDIFPERNLRLSVNKLDPRWNGGDESPHIRVDFIGHNGHYFAVLDTKAKRTG
ncbi:MAG: hypothetical protein ABJB66_18740 [Gemmatimonadaceae bacterium]